MKGVKRFIKLSPAERIALEKGRKNGKKATFRERCHFILLSDQGKEIKELSDIFNCTRQRISKWFDRYEEKGIKGLHTAAGQGASPIIRLENETETKRIEEIVEKSPQNLKRALAKIEAELGKKMSKKTLQRFLKKRLDLETLPCDTSQEA